MFLLSVGIGFLLLFGVLIADGISSGSSASSSDRKKVSPRADEVKGEAAGSSDPPAAIHRTRRFGDYRPVDGTDLAA